MDLQCFLLRIVKVNTVLKSHWVWPLIHDFCILVNLSTLLRCLHYILRSLCVLNFIILLSWWNRSDIKEQFYSYSIAVNILINVQYEKNTADLNKYTNARYEQWKWSGLCVCCATEIASCLYKQTVCKVFIFLSELFSLCSHRWPPLNTQE